MNIIVASPPIYDRIAEQFPAIRGQKGIVYAFGEVIFNPDGVAIPPQILAHEAVHCERQKERGAAAWWESYLADQGFRFEEELAAHRAEYRHVCTTVKDGNKRNQELFRIAGRLASPMYGSMVGAGKARSMIGAIK